MSRYPRRTRAPRRFLALTACCAALTAAILLLVSVWPPVHITDTATSGSPTLGPGDSLIKDSTDRVGQRQTAGDPESRQFRQHPAGSATSATNDTFLAKFQTTCLSDTTSRRITAPIAGMPLCPCVPVGLSKHFYLSIVYRRGS